MAVVSVSWRNGFKTFMIFLAWITKGLYLEASGPAMIDLKLIYNTNYESVTRSIAGRGAGGFVGAILGALLVDKFERHLDLCIAVGTTIAGICITLVPLVPTIDYVWMLYFVIGCSSCAVNMAGTRIALSIWKENNPTTFQLLHMGFGVGALLDPLICAPFLAVITTKVPHDAPGNQDLHYHVIKESRVYVAFLIIGIITCCVAIPFYIFQATMNRHVASKEKVPLTSKAKYFSEVINPATYANGNFRFGLCAITLLFVYFFNLIGGEKIYITFVRTISVDVFHLGKSEASYLNTMFWVSVTVGRFIGAFVARYVHIRTLILAQTILHLGSVTALYFYALTDVKLFWLLTILEGIIVAPLYPLGVAYGSTILNMSGFCLMVIVFAGSFGDLTYLWTAGKMYDTYGAVSILYGASIAAWLLVGCIVIFRIVTRLSSNTSDRLK